MIQELSVEAARQFAEEAGLTEEQFDGVAVFLDNLAAGRAVQGDSKILDFLGLALGAFERGEDTGKGGFRINWGAESRLVK